MQCLDPISTPVNSVMFSSEKGACAVSCNTKKLVWRIQPSPKRIQLGPGKVFRPTPGLCALFARIGTKTSKTLAKPKPPSRKP
jgi:hypothetical protein